MGSELVEGLDSLHILKEKNRLLLGERGFLKVLETSYISQTHQELLLFLLKTHDGNDSSKRVSKVSNGDRPNSNLRDRLDSFRDQIIGPIPWKSQLQDKYGDITHYQELLAFREGGCTAERKLKPNHSLKKCDECYMDSTLEDKPSSLIRFIRNVHAHATEKMAKHPGGVIETFLFPNGYDDQRQFVDYWMHKFPKLFHINAALRNNQTDWLDWCKDSVPDQVLEGLNRAINLERDSGRIFHKYECDQLENGGKTKLEILILNVDAYLKNVGKVVTVVGSTLTVKHGSGDTLIYPLRNPRGNDFNIVFGLEQLSNTTVRSKYVLLIINQYQSVDEVYKCLQQFGICWKVPLKWIDIGGSARRQIQCNGTIKIQTYDYPANKFPLQTLSGNQLSEFLQTKILELFKQENIQPFYVQRWFIRKGPSHSENCAVYFIRDPFRFFRRDQRSISVNSDKELCDLEILTHKVLVLLYEVCVDNVHPKLVQLAAGRPIYILDYGPMLHRTHIVYRDISKLTPVHLVPEDEVFQRETSNLVLISGGAGAGKTSYLKNLAATLHISDTVVLRASATTLLSCFKGDVIDTLRLSCDLNEFETEVIKQLKILLIVDALDEVDELLEKAANFMQTFTSYKGLRLVMSFRTYFLDDLLNLFKFSPEQVYTLADLSKVAQVKVCLSYWNRLDKSGKPYVRLAIQIVNAYGQFLNNALTPLHCGILADIHSEEALKMTTLTTSEDFKPLYVVEMYEALVKKNFHRYLIERNEVSEKNLKKPLYRLQEEMYKRAHVYLAIKQLSRFDPDQLKGPLEHPDITLTPGQGFLDNIHPVIFTHVTFADFFVDTWVFEVISGKSPLDTKYIPAFSEMFRERFVTLDAVRKSHFLERLLQDHKDQLYFPFAIDVFDFESLGRLFYGREQPAIYKTLFGSFKHFSPDKLLEKVRMLQQAESKFAFPFIRPYNGDGEELDRICQVTLHTDFVIKWLGLGRRPVKLLKICPDGFYLETPVNMERPNGDPDQATCYRFTYIPKDSKFAKNKELDEIKQEILVGEDYDNLNTSMTLFCP